MTSIRRFTAHDMFKFNNINLDKFTATYDPAFYFKYLATWPEYFLVAEAPDGRLMSYIMGKAEGADKNWHGHVTALTTGPQYRRMRLAEKMMDLLETISERVHNGYFVDLYVRQSNTLARNVYAKFGYTNYRRVLDYYAGEEAAYDMRKALKRDKDKKSVVPHVPFDVNPSDID